MREHFDFDRAKTCCFTGHRSRDLPFGGDTSKYGMRILISTLYLAIHETVEEGYDTFISGMSDGIDLICADIVAQMIGRGKKLNLICAVPYAGQVREQINTRSTYIYKTLTAGFPTVTLSRRFYRGCYRNRNRFMVDHSSKIIGVYKYKPRGSGTSQTLRLAEKAGLECRIIRLDVPNLFYMDYDDDRGNENK